MEATVYLKNLHISAKKLRFILDDIKKMTPVQSLDHLYYSPKKSARVFYKAVKSAIDNAKYTLKIDENLLKFKLFTVEQGNALKRFRPGGRGTAKPYKKRYAHIKIVLTTGKEIVLNKGLVKSVEKKDVVVPEKKELKIDSTKKRVAKTTTPKKGAVKK